MRSAGRAALAAALVACAGCGGGSDDEPLTIAAAASLTDAFTALGETLPGGQRFSFAGSDELAAQIRQGARPDVFAAADTGLPAELHALGLLEAPAVFAHNRLVAAVPADGGARSLADLARPGLALVVGAEGVPVGELTRAVLARLPAKRSRALLANVRSEEPDVKGVVGKLTQGAADGGFVYASDVAASAGALRAIELDPGLRPRAAYAVAVHADADEPAAAREFVAALLGAEGRAILARHGFEVGERP